MTHGEFERVLLSRIRKIQAVLGRKAEEYARGGDRLHNFKQAAGLLGCTEGEALVGFMAKHVVSVFDLVRDRAGGVAVSPGQVDEKIGDAINYLILLEAVFAEWESQDA